MDDAIPHTPDDPSSEAIAPELFDTSAYRLSDRTALALLAAYLVFRAVTQRIGLAVFPRLLGPAPWSIPLLNNSMLLVITTGTGIGGRTGMFVAAGAASVFLSTVAGMILYWAGWRFGPKLAAQAERSGGVWASLWNPKQVAKAHDWLERWGVIAVFVGRMLEWFTVPVMLVAGSSRMTFRKFIAAHTAGAMAFAGVNLWLGGVAARRWPWLPDRIEELSPWALRIGLILLVLFVVTAFFARGQGTKETTATGGPPPPTDGA